MRIEYDLKLGFKDVMIRPKRSTLKSRSKVSLQREFKFLHSTAVWSGIPIMAANMDTVGTFEMALALAKKKLLGDELRDIATNIINKDDFYVVNRWGIDDVKINKEQREEL